jgi:hypothetical protein
MDFGFIKPRMKPKERVSLVDKPEFSGGYLGSHFLDSGSFSMLRKSIEHAETNGGDPYDYYDTDEFYQYLDAYAAFIKKHAIAIDLYANVDVIGNPELSWRNQLYLEKKGVKPDLKWLKRYLDRGDEYIGLGGLVGATGGVLMKARKVGALEAGSRFTRAKRWVDSCFHMICDQPSRLPKAKIHGFGVNGFVLMTRYPWWSTDATSWLKLGAFGHIVLPHKRGSTFALDEAPYWVTVSVDGTPHSAATTEGLLRTFSRSEKRTVEEWLDQIGAPMGKINAEGQIIEQGVTTNTQWRQVANLRYFEEFRKILPVWPWPFAPKKKGLGL